MASSKEDIISNLRAIIISSKGGLKLSDVRADYKEAFGIDIPLQALGYASLEDFFKKNAQDFIVVGNTVQAVMKPSSVHIVSLISRQKSKERGRSKLKKSALKEKTVPRRLTTPQHKNLPSLAQNVQRPAQIFNYPAQKSTSVQAQKKMSEKMRSKKRITTSLPTGDSEYKTREGKQISSEYESLLFKDFEDLKISDVPPSVLPKTKPPPIDKYLLKNPPELKKEIDESFGSPPPSPFTRSLANTSQEEILMAKKSAQIRSDNNNLPFKLGSRTQVDPTIDVDENSKYEQKLKQFCIEKGIMMPTYSLIIREPFNQPKCYGCKLTIGHDFAVSTYPVETHSEITARELVSKKAFNLLSVNNNVPTSFLDTEYIIKLRKLCSQQNLPDPTFKSIECWPKNEPGYYICKVRIGENILLSSYPEEIRDETTARDMAAKKAYEYLLSDKKSSSVTISKNENVTLSQIFNILKTKEYGVWSNKIQSLYMDTYSEMLPPNWFDLIKNSPQFEINFIEKAGYIVRAKTDAQVEEVPAEVPTLATLKVPESNQWEVYITNVINSNEVWCRLIGKDYSELYDTMMTKLELQPPTINVKQPIVGETYLINLEESWNRVNVKEIFSEKEEALVFLIDIGVDEIVKLSQLFYLQHEFFSVAPQAILLTLNELDGLAECEELQSAMFHSLLGNSFIAEVIAILNETGNRSSVVLWDTSTEEDVNVNLKLLDDVIKTIKGPSLPPIGLMREMYVSHVGDNGDVYLQTSKKNADFVDKIISIKFKNSVNFAPMSGKIDPKKLYITCCNKNGLYYRVKLLLALDENVALVKFIDVGCEEQVSVESLFDLERTSLDLAIIPSQVLRTIISGLKVINSDVLSKMRDSILHQNVLVKVNQIRTGSASIVELFVRSQSDGTLSSVNNKITDEGEPSMADAPVRRKSFVVGLENTLSSDLPTPNIPPIGSYFNVIVTLAAHPYLFCVQPLATQTGLMELMFRLQDECEASFSKPLPEGEFKIGNLYAVKHDDGYWYRAYAHAFVSPSVFTVCLCDFGDLIIVSAERLMPLTNEFKTFPYQAIRAYLAGITPANQDWSPLDCVKFREMVVEKQFVSQVVEMKRDMKNPNFITLGLLLVDTNTSEDVYIHQVLIDNNMAVAKS